MHLCLIVLVFNADILKVDYFNYAHNNFQLPLFATLGVISIFVSSSFTPNCAGAGDVFLNIFPFLFSFFSRYSASPDQCASGRSRELRIQNRNHFLIVSMRRRGGRLKLVEARKRRLNCYVLVSLCFYELSHILACVTRLSIFTTLIPFQSVLLQACQSSYGCPPADFL